MIATQVRPTARPLPLMVWANSAFLPVLNRMPARRAWNARSEERRVGSDWSSDVCSSDLDDRHPGAAHRQTAAVDGVGELRFLAGLEPNAGAPRLERQIGRASCRE